jgi:hypothetical protein
MNVEMRIITDENIDQLTNMSFSNNIQKLLKTDNKNIDEVINNYVNTMNQKLKKSVTGIQIPDEKPILPEEEENDKSTKSSETSEESVPWATGSPAYMPPSDESIPWATGSPAYMPSSNEFDKEKETSSGYNPNMSEENDFGSVSLNDLFKTLPENRKLQVLSIENKEQQIALLKNILSSINVKEDKEDKDVTSILEVEDEKEIEEILEENNSNSNSNTNSNSNSNSTEIKKIIM